MDFHGMKRKELQALCKKHGVPANLTNREMADRLTSIFKENEDPVPLEELSSNPEEICIEDKANAVKKQVKKVRFSPDNQTMEYEVSVYQQPRRRSRRQTLSINPAQALENALTEDIKKFEGRHSRVTRPRVQNAVEEEMHTVSSPPVGRKRGRGGKRNKDAEEVANIGDSDGLELGLKDVNNGHDKVTSGLSGRQLRSRKNVTPEDSKKVGNDKGGDKIHLLGGIYEGKNGPKKSMKNGRKDQCVAFSSDVEKVEVVSRMTRQSRAQSKDVASMVKNEVKIDEVKDGNEIEKPLRRTRNSGKDCAKTVTSVVSDTQTTKVQEQSEIDIAFVEPPECLRRHSSRRKSVVSQSCKGANKEEFLKEETRKRSRTTELEVLVEDSNEVERDKYVASSQQQAPLRRSRRRTVVPTAPALETVNKENIGGMEHLRAPLLGKSSNDELDAIVEDSSEVERAKYAVTSQHQAPSRRGRRKTVILTSPAAKLSNKEDIGRTEQLRAPLLGKGTTEELLRKSSQNSSRYSLSGTSKEEQISVVESNQGVKQQMQEPILEEEIFGREQHPVTQKRQRRSRRITSISASVAPPNATGKGVEKQQQSKSRMETVEEEAAPTESLPSPGNKTNLDLDVSKQVVKSGAAPPFLNTEKDKDSAGNMEEPLTESSVQLVGPSADQEMKQTAQKSMALYEKGSNLVEENVEKLVNGGNFESEVNCMSSQTGKTTCIFKDANWSDPKRLKCESKGSHRADSSMITVPAESHGNEESDQEMMVEFEEFEQDNGLQFAEQKDLTAATSIFLHLEKELGTELPGGEDSNFTSDNVTAACSITPFGEAQIVVELKDTNVAAAESVKEGVFKLNKSSESIGLKSELEILKKAEEMNAIDVSNTQGIPQIDCSVEPAENQESSAQSHSTTAETDAQKIFGVMQSSHSNTVAPGTPFGPAPVKDKCRVEAANAARSGMSDQERSEDPSPGNEPCIHESVLKYEDATGLVKNDDSNLVESRMVSFESSNSKVVSPEIASLADIFSSASRGANAGKTSSRIELKKVLEIQETSENINPVNYSMDDEGIRTLVVEDQIEGKLESANMTIVNTVEQVIFNDLLNELGESIVLKRGSEIPLKTSEKVSATMFSNGKGIILTESSVKAEKQEYITEIDVAAAMNGTPNTTVIKCRSSSDIATHRTSVGLTPQCQGSLDDALVEVASNATKVVSSGMTYLADVYSSVNQIKFASETSNELKLEKVLDLEESSKTENVVNNRLDKIEIKEDTSCAQVVQSSLHLEDIDITAAEPIQEVVIWENAKTDVKEDSGLSQEDQSSVHSEDTNITAAEPVQVLVIWESDKSGLQEETGLAQEDQSLMHAEDTNITAAEPVQAVVSWENGKGELKEDTSLAQEDQSSMHLEDTSMTAAEPVQELVFRESDKTEVKEDTGLAQEDQSSLYSEDTNITAAEPIQEEIFWESDKTEVKEDTGLAQEDQSSMHLEDISITAAEPVQKVVLWESDKMEVKEDTNLAQEDHSSMHLEDSNTTAAESVQEVVFWESDKTEIDEDTSLAQEDQNSIQLEATDITAAEPVQEVVFRERDEMEVKEDTSLAQEDQSSMHLEDTNLTAAESVQEVVFWDHLNKVCESGGTKESRDSLKKAEETGTSDSSAIGMVQTESSVETNEMSEATGQTTIMAIRWSLSSHDKELISPLRPQVASQDYQGKTYRAETDVSTGGCAMPGQLNNEDNAKIVENVGTINTEKEFYVSGQNVTLQSSKGKSWADGVYHPLSESIGSQCTIVKRVDVSDGSFNNVSGETQEKHICEVFDGEGTGPISPEEKDNDILENGSQGIWDEKLPNSFQHAINDMQEKSEAVCMDTRNRIPANILPQLASEQLDNESETSKEGFKTGEVNARAFGNASSESFSMSPLDHALVAGEANASGERVVHHSFIKDFAATMDSNEISLSGETDVVHEDNMAEQIATSPLNVELTDYSGGNVDTELYDLNMSVSDPIFQETDTFGVPSTEYPEVISNEPVAMDAENNGDLDDQGEEVGIETDHSSSFGVDGLTSTVGVTMENSSVVGPLKSILNISYPQSGTKVDDPDINNSGAAKQLDTAFTIEETGVEDGEKAPVSYQRSLHGEHEDVSSSADTPCSKLEISIEKEHPQAMDYINEMVRTKISTECKVIREEMDGCQTKSVGFNDVSDGCFEDESKIGLEELVGAKSDDFEGCMKTDTDLDGNDISDVNQTPCLDERKNCNLETQEPNALPFPETIAGDSREVESCSKLNIVSSIPFLENPDESTIFTNMEMRMFSGVEDEVKKSDAKAGDTNDVALDMAITECNSRDTKEGDHFAKSDVEDTNFCVRKDGPEDTEQTMASRNDFSALDAAMADKSPFSKSSEIGKVADGEETAFRTELNLLNASAKMGRSNSVAVKQLVSSVMKSKSKPGLIQRTPKRPIFHDMKENEGSTKREKTGNRTTPKTASKLRPPLHRI